MARYAPESCWPEWLLLWQDMSQIASAFGGQFILRRLPLMPVYRTVIDDIERSIPKLTPVRIHRGGAANPLWFQQLTPPWSGLPRPIRVDSEVNRDLFPHSLRPSFGCRAIANWHTQRTRLTGGRITVPRAYDDGLREARSIRLSDADTRSRLPQATVCFLAGSLAFRPGSS